MYDLNEKKKHCYKACMVIYQIGDWIKAGLDPCFSFRLTKLCPNWPKKVNVNIFSKGLIKPLSKTIAPIFTNKTSFSQESWDESNKIKKSQKHLWPWGVRPKNYIWAIWTQKRYQAISPEPYNHFQNILRLFDVLPDFPFAASETIRDYYLTTWHMAVVSRVGKLGN